MKNKIENKKIISILLIVLLLFTTNVYAASDSFNTTIQASSNEVERDGNITITLGLKDIAIESGEKGIGGYTANVKFDSSVFEYVSTSASDKWEAPFYQNGLITGNTKDGKVVNTDQSIGTITFKVKKDAKLGETTIELNNFSGSTALTDVDASNKSVKVTIVDNKGNNNNGNNSNNENNSNNGGNNNSGSNNGSNSNNSNSGNSSSNNNQDKQPSKSTSTVTDSSKKKGTLPKTGVTNTVILTVIGICVVLAIIFFVKMRVFNKKIEK